MRTMVAALAAALALSGCEAIYDAGERLGVDVVVDPENRDLVMEACAAGDMLSVLLLGASDADCDGLERLMLPKIKAPGG